jgi:hypothetical protein
MYEEAGLANRYCSVVIMNGHVRVKKRHGSLHLGVVRLELENSRLGTGTQH